MHFSRLASVMLAAVSLGVAGVAQANSSQEFKPPNTWQSPRDTVYGGRVTSQAVDTVEYWVLWDSDNVKVYRVRKDDPSLSSAETALLAAADQNDTGVEVDVDVSGTTNTVASVTAVP